MAGSPGGESQPPEIEIIRSSRAKMALYLLGSLAFVACGAWLLGDPATDHGVAWLATGFFGLCAAVFAWRLVRPQALILDPTGFTVATGLRAPRTTPWRDIQGFFVYRLPRGGRAIGFNFRPGAQPDSALIRFNRSFGAEGALPGGWPDGPDRMVERLNAYRARALGLNAPPSA